MSNLRAVAIFPNIPTENLNSFKSVAQEMLGEIRKQESILRYDLFFSENDDTCVVLEEYTSASGVFEHVERNSHFLKQLATLGGKIQGSMFPTGNSDPALENIKANWDSRMHFHFAGK